jgi:hypothetical protein
MVELTFLELHFHDSDLSAQYGPGEKEVTAAERSGEDPSGSSKGKLLAALVGLVFLAAVAYLVKQRRSDGIESETMGPTEVVERLRR